MPPNSAIIKETIPEAIGLLPDPHKARRIPIRTRREPVTEPERRQKQQTVAPSEAARAPQDWQPEQSAIIIDAGRYRSFAADDAEQESVFAGEAAYASSPEEFAEGPPKPELKHFGVKLRSITRSRHALIN